VSQVEEPEEPEEREEPEREDEAPIPENVPDDWLDQKPFDPAGR
jgi:hypothetical protein